MKRESEKEWYFGNADKERRGPFSFEEVCGLKKFGGTLLVNVFVTQLFCVSFFRQILSAFENDTLEGLFKGDLSLLFFCTRCKSFGAQVS